MLADLAALAARQAQLTAELAAALRAPAAAPAAPTEPSPEYLTPKDAAAHVGVSVRTLENLRRAGKGPEFVRFGRAVRYPARQWHR